MRIAGFAWIKVEAKGTNVKIRAEPDYWDFDIAKKIVAYPCFGGFPILDLIYFICLLDYLRKKEIIDLTE